MNIDKDIAPLPVRPYFTAPQDFLTLRRYTISEYIPPSLENSALFIYVADGAGNIRINGLDYQIRAGSLIQLHCFHVYSIEPSWNTHIDAFVLDFEYAILNYLNIYPVSDAFFSSEINACPVQFTDPLARKHLSHLIEAYEKECQTNDTFSPLIKISILGSFSVCFNELQMRNKTAGKGGSSLFNKIMIYLALSFNDRLTAHSAAAHFNMSTSMLNRILRNNTGYTFDELLNKIRIDRAVSLLLFQDLTFKQICKIVGFCSETSFYRCFKNSIGMTPMKYRERLTSAGGGYYRTLINSNILKIISYAYANYRDDVNVHSAAKVLLLNETTIQEEVNRAFSLSFQQLIRNFRLRYAAALLSITDTPVVDIAIASGFNSSHTFIRLFKEEYLCTPGEYRIKTKRANHE